MCGAGRVATDQPFAQAYLHSGMVGLDGEKMSKSKGNLVFVSSLRASGMDPMAIRLALLAHHYRDDWDWTDELLVSGQEPSQPVARGSPARCRSECDDVLDQVRAALAHDLDAPAALAAVDAWAGASLAIDSDDADGASPGRPCLRRPPRRSAPESVGVECARRVENSRVYRGRCKSEPAVTVRDPSASSRGLMW